MLEAYLLHFPILFQRVATALAQASAFEPRTKGFLKEPLQKLKHFLQTGSPSCLQCDDDARPCAVPIEELSETADELLETYVVTLKKSLVCIKYKSVCDFYSRCLFASNNSNLLLL